MQPTQQHAQKRKSHPVSPLLRWHGVTNMPPIFITRLGFSSASTTYHQEMTLTIPRDTFEWQAKSSLLPFASRKKEEIKLSSAGYFAEGPVFERQYLKVLDAVSDFWIAQINKTGQKLPVIVAMDDSPKGKKYLPKVIAHLNKRGLDVYTYHASPRLDMPIPLGMLAFFTKHFDRFEEPSKTVAGTIMLTAGSRPWSMGGMRFILPDGSLFGRAEMAELDELIKTPKKLTLKQSTGPGKRIDFDFMQGHYKKHLQQLVHYQKIETTDVYPFHDARLGASKVQFQKQFPTGKNYYGVRDYQDVRFPTTGINGQPSVRDKDLRELTEHIQKFSKGLSLGLANNGDAGLCRVTDEKGNILTPSEVIMLLMHHLVENKKRIGLLVKSHETSAEVDELASLYALPTRETPVGFQQVIERIKEEKSNPLLIADGHGGVTIDGNPLIKDGMLTNFLLLELLAYAKKPLSQILAELKKKLTRVYTHKHYVFTSKAPEKVLDYIRMLAKTKNAFGDLKINKSVTREYLKWLEKTCGLKNEIKIFFQNRGTALVRQNTSDKNKFDLFLETSTNKNQITWRNKQLAKKQFDELYSNFDYQVCFNLNTLVGDFVKQSKNGP